MKVALIRLQGKYARKSLHPRNIRPPYLLKYLQAELIKSNIETTFFDEYIGDSVKKIIELSPKIIVISAITSDVERSLLFIKKIKKKINTLKIILCGQDPSGRPDFYINKQGVDYIALGEAEQSIARLITYMDSGLPSNLPDGIIDTNIKNKTFPVLVGELDSLAMPYYSERELKGYTFFYPVDVDQKIKYGHILTSRGCPYGCLFCTQVLRESYGKKMRYHSIDRIIEEIKRLRSQGVNFLLFDDDNFCFDKEWSIAFLNRIIEEDIQIPWQTHIRVENINEEIINLFKKTNCKLIRLGVESGSHKILKNTGKTKDSDKYLLQSERVFKWAKERSISTLFLCLIGNVDETYSDILKTFNFIRKIKPDFLQVTYFTLYPGAPLYEKYSKHSSSGNYHYDLPDFSPSKIGKVGLKLCQFLLYSTFYLRPFYLIKHFKKYFKYYIKNTNDIIQMIRAFIYLIKP